MPRASMDALCTFRVSGFFFLFSASFTPSPTLSHSPPSFHYICFLQPSAGSFGIMMAHALIVISYYYFLSLSANVQLSTYLHRQNRLVVSRLFSSFPSRFRSLLFSSSSSFSPLLLVAKLLHLLTSVNGRSSEFWTGSLFWWFQHQNTSKRPRISGLDMDKRAATSVRESNGAQLHRSKYLYKYIGMYLDPY